MATASFVREKGAASDERGRWHLRPTQPDQWYIRQRVGDKQIRMRLGLTSFKHVGVFPEQAENWNFIFERVQSQAKRAKESRPKVLNMFAYTGGASLAAAAAGAEVTHVDSVKQCISWARENMEASHLEGIRWVVEDALKFSRRANLSASSTLPPMDVAPRAKSGCSNRTLPKCSPCVPSCFPMVVSWCSTSTLWDSRPLSPRVPSTNSFRAPRLSSSASCSSPTEQANRSRWVYIIGA